MLRLILLSFTVLAVSVVLTVNSVIDTVVIPIIVVTADHCFCTTEYSRILQAKE
jgi:hypothetical protein